MKKLIIIGIAALTLAVGTTVKATDKISDATMAKVSEASSNNISTGLLLAEGYTAVMEKKKNLVRQMCGLMTYNQWTNAAPEVTWPALTNQVQVVRIFMLKQANSRLAGATNLTQVEGLRVWVAGALTKPR